MPAFFARALAVLCILHGGVAVAESWKQARPGTSTERQVLGLFGEPTSRRTEHGEHVLTYAEEQAPAGTVRADFLVEARSGRLRRIDVFPVRAPSRDGVERMFGPACRRAGGARKPCYEVRLSSLNEPYFHYASRGLAVFFARGEVRALSYLPPARGRRALTVEVEPPVGMEDAGAERARGGTGDLGVDRLGTVTKSPAHAPASSALASAAPASASGASGIAPASSSGASDLVVARGTAASSSRDSGEPRPATMERPPEAGGLRPATMVDPRVASELRPATMESPRDSGELRPASMESPRDSGELRPASMEGPGSGGLRPATMDDSGSGELRPATMDDSGAGELRPASMEGPGAGELRPASMEGPGAGELRPASMEGPGAGELQPATMDGPGPGMAGNSVSGPRPLNEPEDTASEAARTDVLTLGGFYFQRAETALSRRASDETTAAQPNFPALVDVYLDFRPQENLRTYVVGRLLYDPLDTELSTPATRLDKLWLYFGLFDHVFVTAGRQYVKWGSSRVWNTTDFLRAPNPDPLGVFDLRPGVDMLKVNVPFESLASNLWFFGTAALEDTPDGAPSRIRYGGAVRAEVALGTSELIATASFLEGRRPRYGLDYSLGIGRFDLNAEVALLRDSDFRLWRRDGGGFAEQPVDGTKVQASGGVAAELRMADIYRAVVRLEGFYNELGSTDRELLTWAQSTGDYRPLYFGRLYGMAQLSVTRRSANEPNVSLTVLGNVSDPSFLGRLDFGFKVHEAIVAGFVEAPFGERGGEFRFQPDPSVANLPATDLGLFRVGMSLRLKL
ncbi:hypothetical protein [Pyxidicoccus fallax]|uniref:hypothetical protein n=1 Tax=Pyxidicoccus fallax TaxID=394095 RepID=UPI001B7D7555|nr:hypothetical protein [Pyxidicoccus fallax]